MDYAVWIFLTICVCLFAKEILADKDFQNRLKEVDEWLEVTYYIAINLIVGFSHHIFI